MIKIRFHPLISGFRINSFTKTSTIYSLAQPNNPPVFFLYIRMNPFYAFAFWAFLYLVACPKEEFS